jgi:hypothetical protein
MLEIDFAFVLELSWALAWLHLQNNEVYVMAMAGVQTYASKHAFPFPWSRISIRFTVHSHFPLFV